MVGVLDYYYSKIKNGEVIYYEGEKLSGFGDVAVGDGFGNGSLSRD